MKVFNYILPLLLFIMACNNDIQDKSNNPLLSKFETPFSIPEFRKIKSEHYIEAFHTGIEALNNEIADIVSNSDFPNFNNTILPLEFSGELLDEVSKVFFNNLSMNTSDSLQNIAQEVAPLLSKSTDDIYLNFELFSKIKNVYEQKIKLSLGHEEIKLLEYYYKAFVRGGANFDEKGKDELRKINERLSVLTLQFGNNVLSETNRFKLVVEKEEDLAGLPESIIAAASETAISKGDTGKWVFTIHKPSMIPFLQYSENRALRKKLFSAYISKGDNDNEYDNKNIVKEIIALRLQKAKLLGYRNHAEFILAENMAKEPESVYRRVNGLLEKALVVAQEEAKEIQTIIDREENTFKLEPSDWWYYAEKIKKSKYSFDETELRQYFQLDSVLGGLFSVANRLYGIQFEKTEDVPIPHPDAIAFKVTEADGALIGILYMDFFPRESKRAGAWMSSYRKQCRKDDISIVPLITMVCNFTKPTESTPALLSFEEVSTLFHEFGHALHGLLSNCTYKSLSGTAVARDFVELPSQIMENWVAEPEVLKSFAKHYLTGETISDDLIAKLNNSSQFNQGFETSELLAAAVLDMDYHTIEDTSGLDITEFENRSLEKMKLIPEIVVRYRSTYFNHIFSGGYSAGYYSYIWAEILDADAFALFKEKGIFDQETAASFRENILERGATEDPMSLYMKFRGAEPDVQYLINKRGLQ